jgi:hypothetical protein
MRVLLFSLLFLISSVLYGSNCKLIYEQSDVTFMELRNVNGDIIYHYSNLEQSKMNMLESYKFQAGTYRLRFCFDKMRLQTDTLEYDFQLKGTEQEVHVSISKCWKTNINTGEEWESDDPKGFITIWKYYPIPQGILIELQQSVDEKGNEWPLFKLTNNTQFDLYGESIPGEFYGSISYMMADSTWGKPIRTGKLFEYVNREPIRTDELFENVNREPLHPGQSTFAKIGDYLPGFFHWQDGLYRYNIQISDTKTNIGTYSPTIFHGNYRVYTQNVSLYNLNYEFKWQRNK